MRKANKGNPKVPFVIPKDDTKEGTLERRGIIKGFLNQLIKKEFPCKAFGKRTVSLNQLSIDETARHAARSYESTLAVMYLREALKNSILVKTDTPKSNKQIKMGFKKIYELSAEVEIGEVKIIVGERANERLLHYCITKKR